MMRIPANSGRLSAVVASAALTLVLLLPSGHLAAEPAATAEAATAEPTASADAGLLLGLLSPSTDFASVCRVPGADVPSSGWEDWDGSFDSVTPEQAIEAASRYAGGSAEVVRDKVLARKILEHLVAHGSDVTAEAQYALARLLLDEESGPVDEPRAVALLRKGIQGGIPGAMLTLGNLYETGRGRPQDPLRAAQLYRTAAVAGDADGALNLVHIYNRGLLQPPMAETKDQLVKIAVSLLLSELAAGDCSAIRKIADLHADEQSPFYDLKRAVQWYEAAVRVRDVDAALALANAYRFGVGVAFDNARALELLGLAASEGSALAMRRIGEIYLYGEGVSANWQYALAWLERAAEANDSTALNLIARIHRGEFAGIVDVDAYIDVLERMTRLPDAKPRTLVDLARALMQRRATPDDRERAIALLERAAAQGETRALVDLAMTTLEQPADGDGSETEEEYKAVQLAANVNTLHDGVIMGGVNDSPAVVVPLETEPETVDETTSDMQADISMLEMPAIAAEPPVDRVVTSYVVEPGDALSLIAEQYGMTLNELSKLNNLEDSVIHPGETLKVLVDAPPAMPMPVVVEPEEVVSVSAVPEHFDLFADLRKTNISGIIRARSYLRSAANAGDGEAMRVLSEIYRCGIGTEPDPELALKWLERAVAAGDVRSLKAIVGNPGLMGSQVNRVRLLKQAAWLGDRESMIDLAIAYEQGEAGPPNPNLGEHWRVRALAHGSGRNGALVHLAKTILAADGPTHQDVETALNLLSDAAFDGEVDAQVVRAKVLLRGVGGVDPDIELAREYLVRAANVGNIEAALTLAEQNDVFLAPTGRTALDWIEAAASHGSDRAIVALAATSETEAEKRSWIRQLDGVNVCDAEIMVRIARIYDEISVSKEDSHRAAYWLTRASKMLDRDARSNYLLAQAYADGVGGMEEDEQAAAFYSTAADQGNPNALRMLGRNAVAAARDAEDWGEALRYFEKAADVGEAKAPIDLMKALYERSDVPEDTMARAVALLKHVADDGSSRAARELGLLYQTGRRVTAAPEKGAEYLLAAAKAGDAIAMREIGKAYRAGYGVPVDPATSTRWIMMAAEHGDQKAMALLSSAYRVGFGVNVNPEEAHRWQSAAEDEADDAGTSKE